MSEQNGRNPDLEVAEALNELVRKLKGRAENADRYVRHKRTLDKVIPKLTKIVCEITGEEPEAGGSQARARGQRQADATDAIVAMLSEGPRTRAELRTATQLHPKTLEGALNAMVRERALAFDGDTERYALVA